jgi:hypothetical protein
LLNEVMALKGEVGETARPGGQTESAIDSMKTMETVYAEAYHSALASRKATRRKEAEGFATTQVVVVSSSVKEGTYFPITTFRLPDFPYEIDTFFFTLSVPLAGRRSAQRRQRDHIQPQKSKRPWRERAAVHAPGVQRLARRAAAGWHAAPAARPPVAGGTLAQRPRRGLVDRGARCVLGLSRILTLFDALYAVQLRKSYHHEKCTKTVCPLCINRPNPKYKTRD